MRYPPLSTRVEHGCTGSGERSVRRRRLCASTRRRETAMRLVERHVIKRADPRFTAMDRAAFASKNLYNKALDATRQAFFQDGSYPSYPTLYHHMKGEPEYAALPRKVAQWVLKQVCTAWESYKEALAAWGADPFLDQPRIPRYKPKQQGRNLLVYTTQALSGASGNRLASLAERPCAAACFV